MKGTLHPKLEYLELPGAIDRATVDRLRGEMTASGGRAAVVLGAAPSESVMIGVRKATLVEVGDATRAKVADLLEGLRVRLAGHFGRALDAVEPAQFLRYGPGDFFVAHQDGNTPVIHDDSRFRKVSLVLFLSQQSEEPAPGTYSGGALVLRGPYTEPDHEVSLAPTPGTVVAYPSETTHEVLPVTHGERLTIVSWYRSHAE